MSNTIPGGALSCFGKSQDTYTVCGKTYGVSFNQGMIGFRIDDFIDRFKNFSLGGEFTLSDYLNLRIGYNNQQRQNLKTGSSIGIGGFSAGIGFRYEDKYFIDYGFNSMGNIGATHRINLKYVLE
jgi:hypothetical protein